MGYLPGRGRFLGGVAWSVPNPSLTVWGDRGALGLLAPWGSERLCYESSDPPIRKRHL